MVILAGYFLRAAAAFALVCTTGFGQVITTVAGSAFVFPKTPLPALNAPLGSNFAARAVDASGNLFLVDFNNNRVFQVSPSGILTVVAGNGLAGYSGDGGPAVDAALFEPFGVALDGAGNIYIGDSGNNVIRKVTSGGIITTIAGNSSNGYSGDGGPATAAEFGDPQDVVVDAAGNLYIADTSSDVVRKVSSSGIVTTIAGNGKQGYSGDGGLAIAAELNYESGGLAVDGSGNLYIADSFNNRIRKVSPDGIISTVAGDGSAVYAGEGGSATATGLCGPVAVAADNSGNLFIADLCITDHRILKVSPNGIITTFAGNGSSGHSGDGGPATAAAIDAFRIIVDAAGNLYISDLENYVRKVSVDGLITTIAGDGQYNFSGDGGTATRANLNQPNSVAMDKSGNLYIADTLNFRIRKVSPTGVISTIAGNGVQGTSGDGGPAIAAQLVFPEDVAVDSVGNLYIADYLSIRRVSPAGIITTVVHGLNGVSAVRLDAAGNLYGADSGSNLVFEVSASGKISILAPNISLNSPMGVAVGSDGTIYIADTYNQRILAVSPAGIATTVAGTGMPGYSGDGGPATAAELNYPVSLALDATGNLYFADTYNNVIRKVSHAGTITTVIGNGTNGFSGDGGPAVAAELNGPGGLSLDAVGDLYIADVGNDRIRQVLTSPPALSSSAPTFQFSGSSAGIPSPAQILTVFSSIPYVPFTVSVSTKDGTAWLSVDTSSGVAPRAIQVIADPSDLSPGSYSGTITIQSDVAAPGVISIPVSFSVGPGVAPSLAIDQSDLTFAFPAGSGARSQSVRLISKGGGGFYFYAFVFPGASWLSVGPSNGLSTVSQSATLTVTANPSGLVAGTYTGRLAISTLTVGSVIVPVTMIISTNPSALLLSQAGVAFTAIAGGGVVPPQNFGIVTFGSGALNLSADSATVTGGNWLAAAPSPSGGLPSVNVTVNPAGLAAGQYYGLVNVRSPAAANSPQVATAVLRVLPAGTDVGAILSPNELTFNSTAGGESPSSQIVSVYDLTAKPKAFTASSSSGFVQLSPVTGLVTPDQPTLIVVQPFTRALAPGTYQTSITLQFDDSRVRTIGLTIVVTAPSAVSSSSLARHRLDTGDACEPTQLLPSLTSLGGGFSVPAGWPVVLQSQVQDDCGTPLESGSVIAEFSNGDPPLSLQSLTSGRWDATWQTGHVAAGVTVTLRATSPDMALIGSKQVLGGFDSSEQPPTIATGGITDTASNISFRPLAPGSMISIAGTLLSDQTATAATVPYGTSLGESSIVMAGNLIPVAATGPNQLSAIIPYGIAANTQQQIIVLRANALSLPVEVNLAAASPAIFTTNGSQGMIVDAKGNLVAAGNAAKAGDSITVYCTGLGELQQAVTAGGYGSATDATVAPVSLSIGGQASAIQFSGLAPQLVGIYFVQATVPAGVTASDQVPVTLTSLTAAPAVSPTVTMAVTN